MGFPNLLPFKLDSEVKIEAFFALEISEMQVKAAVWIVGQEGNIEVLKTSEVISLESIDDEAVLRAVDMAIATASEEATTEPGKIIFGLPEEWVDSGGIKPEKRGTLKFLCKKLELEPLGFVVTQDALITYLQQEQGTPPSAIFIRFSEKSLLVTLVELGKIIEQQRVHRSGDVTADVKEGLVRFKKVNQLPARIILYNSHTDFEDIKQQLLTVTWEKELPFLHTPKVDSLPSEATIKAVAVAGGKEAAKSLGLESYHSQQPLQAEPQNKTEEMEDVGDTSETQKTDTLPEGFVVGDVTESVTQEEKQPEEVAVPETKSEDLKSQEKTLRSQESLSQKPVLQMQVTQNRKNFIFQIKTIGGKSFGFVKHFFQTLRQQKAHTKNNQVSQKTVPAKHLPLAKSLGHKSHGVSFLGRKKFRLGLIVVAVAVLVVATFGGGFWFYWNKPKADIVLYMTPNTIDKEVKITVSTEATTVDSEQYIIPGRIEETSVTGAETILTTGTKRIGEKASGSVTIYNKTAKSKSFSPETVLVGPGGLRYVLSQEVTVASRSATETVDGEQITFGKAEAKVVAGDIGAEYNSKAETEMTFKNLSEDQFSARVKNEITGGTSKEVPAVSKEDQVAAREALIAKLEAEAKAKIEQQIGSEVVIISETQESELVDESFDQKVGAEAESLTIEGKLSLTTLVAKKADLDVIIFKALAAGVTDNFEVSSEAFETHITAAEPSEEDENAVILSVQTKAQLMPKLDFPEIKRAITGKNPAEAEEYFKSLPNFAKTKIVVTPALPGKLGTLPRKQENIVFTVSKAE
ncbi:MAG: hypothetical protein ACOX6V_04260 [Patescibacteria group bacterium]|jgi:hypothetical protein